MYLLSTKFEAESTTRDALYEFPVLSKVLDERSGRLSGQYIVAHNQAGNLLCTIPNIRIVQNRGQEEVEQHDNRECIAGDVKRGCKGIAGIVDLCPIDAYG